MESLRLITSNHIQQFSYCHENERSMERVMSESLPLGGVLSHTQRARMMQMIADMARLRSAHTYVQVHPIVTTNPEFGRSLLMIVDLECLIAAKRQKIIELGAQEIAEETSEYLRSHLFDRERFGRLAIERSFSSSHLFAKWNRLVDTVTITKTRLSLLASTLDGIEELFTTIDNSDNYESVEMAAKVGNEKVKKRFMSAM